MWRIFSLFSPDTNLDPALGHRTRVPTYPLSVRVEEPTNATKMMSVLRDHYEGTPFDLTKGPAAGPWGTPDRWGGGARALGMWRLGSACGYRESGECSGSLGAQERGN